jgi:hypothetical protein
MATSEEIFRDAMALRGTSETETEYFVALRLAGGFLIIVHLGRWPRLLHLRAFGASHFSIPQG